MRQYKVLSQKDKWFSGKFDPEALENALNAYAKQGWRVVSSVTASMSGLLATANREEIVIILERDDSYFAEQEQRQKKLTEVASKTFGEGPAATPAPKPAPKPAPPMADDGVYRL